MIDHASVSAPKRQAAVDVPRRRWSLRSIGTWRWESALAVGAVAAAAVGVWVTLRAGFLQYPAWLAVQKADFIVGPIGVGLYWHYRRPRNRLGLLLIVLGLTGIPYVLASATVPVLFGIGALWEVVIYVMTSLVILAFPSGRIEGLASKLIIAAVVVGVVLLGVVASLITPDYAPAFSISGCKSVCPHNGLAIWSAPSLGNHLNDVQAAFLIGIPIATASVLIWRFVTGTPPRRRALAIGGPIALLFLVMQATYRTVSLLSPDFSVSNAPVHSFLQWTFAGARAFIWYGFLFALIAAELFAGRTLRRLVGDSLGRPSLRELERTVRGPLGDPGLRLGFSRSGKRDWAGADGVPLDPPGADQALTEVEWQGRRAIAIVHDSQLSEDPELLQAAGAVALLALENAELEGAWRESMRELADSRLRITKASDRERRRLERDLHDGAQQRLVAIQVRLRLLEEDDEKGDLDERLEAIRVQAEEAVEELRTLAHGIYPPLLRDFGLAHALRSLALRSPVPIEVADRGVGRCSAAVEAAIYFCALEAVQNAVKHAGAGAHVRVVVGRSGGEVYFSVADDGVGMAVAGAGDGMGLVGMRDRMGAVGGELEVVSSPGVGTTVRGTVPIDRSSPASPQPAEGSG